MDYARGWVTIVLGKARRTGWCPSASALDWVDRYVHDARPQWLTADNRDEPALFIGREGFRFMPGSVTALVHQYMLKAGVGKIGSAHMLRHTMATLMLEGGADIRYIQEMLGHAALVSTEVYTHVSIGKLKEVHDATHPAAHPGHVKAALDEETRVELQTVLTDDTADDDNSIKADEPM